MKIMLIIGMVIIVTLLILRLNKPSFTSIENSSLTDSKNANTDNNVNTNNLELEIFIDEAEEAFQNIEEQVNLLATNPDAYQAKTITEIRRSFFTLKGAGRMVGLNEIANHAERTEMHLNAILDKSQPYSRKTIDVVNNSMSEIKHLVDELKIKINYENS